MEKTKTIWWVVGIALVLYIFVPGFKAGVNNLFAGIMPGVAPVEDRALPGIEFCPYDGATMTIGPMQKQFAPTESMSTQWARLFVNGVDKGLKNDDSTIAVNYKDSVEIYYGENSSTYYASEQKFAVPCTSSFSTADESIRGNTEYRLYQIDDSTHLNLKCFDEDDGLLNAGTGGTGGTSEALGSGEVVNLDCSIQGNYEDAFSPYGDILVTLRYNSTAYDDFDLQSSTSGFTFTKGAAIPTFRSTDASATGYDLKGFKLSPGIISNARVDFTMTIDTDDDRNPTISTGNITLYFDDQDWYKNSDTGNMEFGYENDADEDIGDTTDNTKHLAIS